MNKNLIIALATFVVLLVAVLALRGKPDSAGVKQLTLTVPKKEDVTKIELTLPARVEKSAPDAGPAEVKDPAKLVVLERIDGSWKVSDGAKPDKKFLVEESQASAALSALDDFRAGDLIADKADKLAGYDIDDQKGHRIKIYTGSKLAADLMFGRNARGGGSTVRLSDSHEVFVAKGRLGTAFKKEVTNWRKKQMVETKVEDMRTVTVKPVGSPSYTVTASDPPPPAEPEDGGVAAAPKLEWKLVDPPTLPAGFRLDPLQVPRVASNMTGIRAQDFAEDVTDEVAGFAGPHTVVEATSKDGKKMVVHLGKEDDKKRVYARVDGDPQVYLLASYTAKQAGRTLDDLRDMSLVDVKIEDIERVTFKGSASTIVVKKVETGWKLAEPKTAPPEFDEGQIQSQVAAAARLKATRLAPADATGTGFDKAAPSVELVTKDGKKHVVRFGAALPAEPDPASENKAAEPREYFIKGSSDDLTYVAAAYTRKRYDNPAALFKKPPSQPQGFGSPGSMNNLDGLPPNVRKQLEDSLKKAQH